MTPPLPAAYDVIMTQDTYPAPIQFKGITISSTFRDLKEHRSALIDAIAGQGLTPIAMENDAAKLADVIDSSLQMVRDGYAYIGIIGHKYGQTPECETRNPNGLSITELEFNEAQRLGRPILLFVMGDDHPVRKADVESDVSNLEKLDAFRQRAKQMEPRSPVHRVYARFDSLEDFKAKAIQSVAALRRRLDEQSQPPAPQPFPTSPEPNRGAPIPAPPALYAEPPYIGSHQFVGRKAQLETLSDWAGPADPHSVLLFEAIGGTGKSMLTWEWTTKHATDVRDDWAGRFWYSFYEKGAIMADFCRRALVYITGQPLKTFRKKKPVELGELLLRHLQARPWLLVLDGLERVLVAYHRLDAAQLPDEEAGSTDEIANRDPCAAIRPEDDDLLRALVGATPSKLLLTTRLTPRILLNAASQPIPGVLRERLPGLRPADAEALLRSCGVSGTSYEIQNYLQSHCNCHPLVTGVLAGLINHYLPARGDFDKWASDADHGGRLNLANLDLIQKRNHILDAAFAALPEKSRQLLSTLALLSEAVDYVTLSALNPHLPATPNPSTEAAQHDRLASQELAKTVHDLEQRGLLQYDPRAKRHDLHPVVRGIAAGGLRKEEKEQYGQRVVDHFSQQAHSSYEQAETLDDIRHGLHVVRVLLQMGRYQEAYDAYAGDLCNALSFNLEARSETLALIRPFFPNGWATLPSGINQRARSYLANNAGLVLSATGQTEAALAVFGVGVLDNIHQMEWVRLRVKLANIASVLEAQNRLAQQERCVLFALQIAFFVGTPEILFRAGLDRFRQLALGGRWPEADSMWQTLKRLGRRNWSRALYREGEAEFEYARYCFWHGTLKEEHLSKAEQLATAGKSRNIIRTLHGLRGAWHLEHRQWALASNSLHEGIRMAREVGQTDAVAEAQHLLAKFHLKQVVDPRREAELLATQKEPPHGALAELWLAVGYPEHAKKHALAAYRWAVADGEPYVRRYELTKIQAVLKKLHVNLRPVPTHDPAKGERLFWESEVTTAVEKLKNRRGLQGDLRNYRLGSFDFFH